MHSQSDLDQFYEGLVHQVQQKGGDCAITSGMACVRYRIAQSTKDCDILCGIADAPLLLEVLRDSSFFGARCSYRGNLSPPLEPKWLSGGWTAHFQWRGSGVEPHLDVFGLAPRASTRWETEIDDLYVHRHTVAEMKRTNRSKDWPYATALGLQMLTAGDARGWLHIFDCDLLTELVTKRECPDPILERRPVLRLALNRDPRLRTALVVESHFWHELDRVRTRAYEQAIRPYRSAVMGMQLRHEPDLGVQHQARVECAERHLVVNPLKQLGFDQMLAEAMEGVRGLGEHWIPLMPDIRENFDELFS